VWGHGFSEAVTRKSLLDPNSESGVVDPNSGVAGFSEAVTLRKYVVTFLFFLKCTSKHGPYVMRYAGSLDVRCVRT
jgi:hypothetical protein